MPSAQADIGIRTVTEVPGAVQRLNHTPSELATSHVIRTVGWWVGKKPGACYHHRMNQLERFAGMVAANQFLTLSTSHGDYPWISPVYFAADEEFKFYFISRRD